MGRYALIENEAKFCEMISISILEFDRGAKIEIFETFEGFMSKYHEHDNEDKTRFSGFNLYIMNLNTIPIKLWKQTLEFFHTEVNPTGQICLTGYEDSNLTHEFLHQLKIYNFIFKPFDSLLLKESLNFALNFKKETKALELISQRAMTFVGILKDIELQSLSELGFVTLSDAQIPVGSLSKYLSHLFQVDKKESVWGQCLSSISHPKRTGFFINKFQFFAIEIETLNQIRHYVQSRKQDSISNTLWNLANPNILKSIKIAIVATENPENRRYKLFLEEHFGNVKVELVQLVKGDSHQHDVVINSCGMGFAQLNNAFKEAKAFFLITDEKLQDSKLKEYSGQYKDVFRAPLDRTHMYKKMKAHVEILSATEEEYLLNISCHEKMKAANTVEVTDVNELQLSFYYSRNLAHHEFRNFVFLNKEEDQRLAIPAFCHNSTKQRSVDTRGAEKYLVQFAFFGMTDHYLKEVRMWLLHNHILHQKK